MTTENLYADEKDPIDPNSKNSNAPGMGAEKNDMKNDDDDDEEDDDDDDEEGYDILPSNDSGITADDNAATGKMHEKEGE